MPTKLPERFAALEPFAEKWSLRRQEERYAERLRSSMEEMQAFYDVMLKQIDDVLGYLNGFPLHALQPDAAALLFMSLSFVEIARPIELWGQPDNCPPAFDPRRLDNLWGRDPLL